MAARTANRHIVHPNLVRANSYAVHPCHTSVRSTVDDPEIINVLAQRRPARRDLIHGVSANRAKVESVVLIVVPEALDSVSRIIPDNTIIESVVRRIVVEH